VRDVEDAAGLAAPAPEPRYDLERLRRALAQIDPGDRRIVTLKHFDGLTFAQIAPHVDLVLNTVKTRYYRSLDRLRVILDRPEGAARS